MRVEVIAFESPPDGKSTVVIKSLDFGTFGLVASVLGAMLMDARQLSRTEIVIAGMVMIGAVGCGKSTLLRHHRRVRSGQRRFGAGARQAGGRAGAGARHGVSGLWVVPLAVGAAEHRLRATSRGKSRAEIKEITGCIVQEVQVALTRPRDVSSPEFNALRRELSALLHSNHARVLA